MQPTISRRFLIAAGVGTSARVFAQAGRIRWSTALLQKPAQWYSSAEARAVADSVIGYQSPEGGWPKNTDLALPPSPDILKKIAAGGSTNTIDNGATTTPLHFLARMVEATAEAKYRESFDRGIDYLLTAQYPNGGWPQFFPLRKGYYSHITYNDGAMVKVLTLLRDIPGFVDTERRAKANVAVTRGVGCILRTQVKQDGKLTAWCAQHDVNTLAPAWARAYEPPSLSGAETVGVIRFLMQIDRPAPEVVAAVQASVAWLQKVPVRGLRVEDFTAADGKRDRRAVPDPDAPPLLARFYELGTKRPIFLGRDSIVRYDLNEIERERRTGYSYLGSWPADLVTREYPLWREKQSLNAANLRQSF